VLGANVTVEKTRHNAAHNRAESGWLSATNRWPPIIKARKERGKVQGKGGRGEVAP